MSHLPYVSTMTRANWRDEVRVCPDCGENYWPAKKTTKARWEAQQTCADPCGRLRGTATSNANRAKAAAAKRAPKP